ncbi:MAG: TniQ family protein [Solirubrobacteraceae bacterium]
MRTLPLRLSPVEGESLPGYVARYSHTFQFPPGDVITALGLDDGSGTVVSAGRYGVSLSPDRLRHAAFATGLPVEMLERMLLGCYAGRAFEQTATATDVLADAAQAHEVLIRSSKFCPHCLREHGTWLLRWQLGWSAVCPGHRVLLARACPTCATVPKDMLRSTWASDRHGPLSDPTRCTRRLGRELCRTDLTVIETPSVSDHAVGAQRRIDMLLDGGPCPEFAGARLEPVVYLRCLHTVCKLLAYHAQPPSQADQPPARSGRRLFDDPATIKAVLPDALALADLPNRSALVEAVREIVEDRYHHDGSTLRLGQLGAVPDTLRDALRHALSEAVWAPPLTKIGLHPRAHRRPVDLDTRLQARHVPQLLRADDYQHQIAELFDFDDFTHWHARRLCSLLLARMLTPLDWDAAVRYLDFPDTFINKGYTTTSVKLRTIGRFDELVRRVKRIANQHAEQQLVDYKHRRAQLADWTGIDPETWQLLQPRPGQSRWRTDAPSRRARASVWLWCELTSGHERAAPIALPTSNLAHQGEFIRDALPDLRERLVILGQLLLATAPDARHIPAQLETTLRERGYVIFRPDTTSRRHRLEAHERRERPKPPRVPAAVADRVLAHVAAHTGVDIPTLTTTSFPAIQTPPAVMHARLLAAALLQRAWPTSWNAIGEAINRNGIKVADEQRAYQAALQQKPRLINELDQLQRAIENPQTPAPSAPTTPHQQRMRHVAETIQAHAAQLLTASHGADVARRTSIALCREYTDLTCEVIAAIHRVTDAQPTHSRATITKNKHADADFSQRYQQLLHHARAAQRTAGFAHPNLKRGLTTERIAVTGN